MTRPFTTRNAEILALHDSGATDVEIAAAYQLHPSRVGAIVRRLTEPRPVGRRPSGAVTPRTARGQAALATLVADAAAAGIEVEAYLDRVREMTRAG